MVKAVKVKRKNSNGKYTQEEVKQIIDTRWGKGKYILMSTYKNKRTKLHLYCTKHDLYFGKYLYQLQRNGTCPKCNKENFTEKRRVSYKLLDEETRYFSAERNRRLEQLTFFLKYWCKYGLFC